MNHPFLSAPPANAHTNIKADPDLGSTPIDFRSLPSRGPVTNLDIDVTEACNLACVYCFKSELYGQYMTQDVMRRAFEWLLAASGRAIDVNCNFMGGEPTLRWRDIQSFVIWARGRAAAIGKRATFSMTSNMTIWTEEIRSFVDEYGFGVLMSIDGCPDVQDAQRPAKNGQKVSDKVAFWAKSMLQTRPGSTARSTLHPDYVHRYAESLDYLFDLGFREVTISASDYAAWTSGHFEELECQLRMIEDSILNSLSTPCPRNTTFHKYVLNKLIRHRVADREQDIVWQTAPCGAGKGYMMIDYVGDIWPCHRFDGADTDAKLDGATRLGNIFKEGFHEDLQDAFLSFDHSRDHKEQCSQCPVNPICAGYCPAANLSDTGSLYTPHDNYCRWAQALYRSAERLAAAARVSGKWAELLETAKDTHHDGR
jgi:uncharacterized protein